MSTQSPAESLATLPVAARDAVQRRRREMALTARWLRELRGTSGGTSGARPTARFTRSAKH